MVKIGIIGGSGLDNPNILQDAQELPVVTPYGNPSSTLKVGKIAGIDVVLLARHGRKHEIPPTQVNYRANIQALKDQKCTHILATTACGSLKEEIDRGHFVIIDQFIDFTKHRAITYHERFDRGPVHTPMAEPFNPQLRQILYETCKELNLPCHENGTVVTIEGPRFSTKAESFMFKSWGADVINMSVAPEAILANEAGIPYAAIAMSTDYDCWKEAEEAVSWEQILEVFNKNAESVKQILIKAIPKILNPPQVVKQVKKIDLREKIRTVPNWPKEGIMFRDITTLIKDPEGYNHMINQLVERYKNMKIDVVAGIESRGFITGAVLANKLGIGFIPIRKKGKLPAETISEDYALEYGTATIEIHKDAIKQGDKVLLVDDLIATGGTALAGCNLIKKLGGEIVECSFIVDLPDLGGKKKLQEAGYQAFNLIDFEGD